MSGAFFKSLFPECKDCNSVSYSETSFLKRHYRQKHDPVELLKKAESIGLIEDMTKYHPINIVIEKLVKFASRRINHASC